MLRVQEWLLRTAQILTRTRSSNGSILFCFHVFRVSLNLVCWKCCTIIAEFEAKSAIWWINFFILRAYVPRYKYSIGKSPYPLTVLLIIKLPCDFLAFAVIGEGGPSRVSVFLMNNLQNSVKFLFTLQNIKLKGNLLLYYQPPSPKVVRLIT